MILASIVVSSDSMFDHAMLLVNFLHLATLGHKPQLVITDAVLTTAISR